MSFESSATGAESGGNADARAAAESTRLFAPCLAKAIARSDGPA